MYDEFQWTVLEFMKESGGTATLIKAPSGKYNPALGTLERPGSEIPVQAILMDLTLQSNGAASTYKGMIEAGDKEAYIRPNPDAPFTIDAESDTIKFGNTVYKVVTMKEINPSFDPSKVLLYFLYLKR